jgi:hypothetical protein
MMNCRPNFAPAAALAVLCALALVIPTSAAAEPCPNEAIRVEQHSTALPDCRAYEQVSPADKGGGGVIGDPSLVRPSVAGDAVGFSSLTPFGDALGSGIAAEFISQRTAQPETSGWSTHAIMPQLNPNGPATLQRDTRYEADFSADLSKGVLRTYTPLTNDPNVSNVVNLYLRQDALVPGPGTYNLLSACPACSAPLTAPHGLYSTVVAAETPDLSHIVFEATAKLTADAPDEGFRCHLLGDIGCTPNLYEWGQGTLRFVGILPDGSAAPISVAGDGVSSGLYTINTISPDGSKIFFTDTSAGDHLTTGNLYMRVHHASTVQLNASERTDCAEEKTPCTGALEPDPAGSPQPARFMAISADGSRVFFRTNEQLTDTPGSDLYVYDTTLPASDPHKLAHVYVDQQPDDETDGTQGVMGLSSDGSYAYFTVKNAILPGQPVEFARDKEEYGVYGWHNGEVRFIGSIDTESATTHDLMNASWSQGPRLGTRVPPDGRTLLFQSRSGDGLTHYNHGSSCGSVGEAPCEELYRYRWDTGLLTCVTCNPSGALATSDATFTGHAGAGGSQGSSHVTHPLSDDGDHVFFETGERLLPEQDVNGNHSDVYEWTAADTPGCTGTTPGFRISLQGCLALITPGSSGEDAHFMDATANGRDVFFTTNQRLSGWDPDDAADLYDARIGGGFPEPPPAPVACSGEACQGANGAAPGAPTPASGSFQGEPSSAPPHAAQKPLTRAQKLKRPLRACKAKHNRTKRKSCERAARKRYGKQASRAGGHR